MDASRPCWIAGRATLTTDASMEAMLEPRTVVATTQRLACEAQPGVSGAPRITPLSHGGDAMVSTRGETRSIFLFDRRTVYSSAPIAASSDRPGAARSPSRPRPTQLAARAV